MERLEGLDEEFQKEETEKVTSIEETKKKRPPFHYWEVAGVQHKMKLNTGMITKLENKYRTNIMTLVTANDIPPPFQCIKLFFFLPGNCQFPLIRDDRKIFILPAFISFIIAIRRQIFRQMPQAPAHDTVLSGKKSFLPVLRPDHTGDRS